MHIDFNDIAKYIKNYACVHQLGRLVMVHGFSSDTDNHDFSL